MVTPLTAPVCPGGQVTELHSQAEHLERMAPEKADEVKEKKERVQKRFESLKTPLIDRQQKLTKKKNALQFRRDIEDEKLWIAEKLPQANSPEFGDSLVSVHMLTRRNQSLQNEISNHEPRINAVSAARRGPSCQRLQRCSAIAVSIYHFTR